mmetsp:Transcript_68056/g.76197  ORF Transcript_68056/g.76197 Transcript_68056/m.76197 type:complete len:245 (+) Transcript_68056:69-803(+)
MDNVLRSSSSSAKLLFVSGLIYHYLYHTTTIDALQTMEQSSMSIVFGRPGSGKTTVANKAFEFLSLHNDNMDDNDNNNNTYNKLHECVELDLDVFIPQVMRDNFSKGIYPSLEERSEFAVGACDHVEKKLGEKLLNFQQQKVDLSVIISFSFVNTDLRDIFRYRFPNAEWILIDTSEEECTKRIHEREGHFYKGGKPVKKEIDNKEDNSEWKFAPVTFPHIILDGNDPIEDNAKRVVKQILGRI